VRLARVELRERRLHHPENRRGVHRELAMQNPPRDRERELHGVLLGFDPQTPALPGQIFHQRLKSSQHRSLPRHGALFGSLLGGHASLLASRGNAGLYLALDLHARIGRGRVTPLPHGVAAARRSLLRDHAGVRPLDRHGVERIARPEHSRRHTALRSCPSG
jgi:hypothetical protein